MEVIKNNVIPFISSKENFNKNNALRSVLQLSMQTNSKKQEKLKQDRQRLNQHILRVYRLKK